MKTHRFRGLIWLVGCLGCVALADESADSPTQEVLDAFPYQPALVARPAPPSPPSPVVNPEVAPAFAASVLDYQDYDVIAAAIRADQARRNDALFIWNLRYGMQLKVVERPSVQELDIPWSPMTTTTDVTFSPEAIGSISSKLQVRVPLMGLNW